MMINILLTVRAISDLVACGIGGAILLILKMADWADQA